MIATTPRIQLDTSRLLGFRQIKGARPGAITAPQAKVGGVAPEPSAYVELVVGILAFVAFYCYRRFRVRKSAVADGESTPSSQD